MMIRKKLAVLMLTGVTCLASGCGNVVKDGTEALGEGRYDAAETAFEEATKNGNKEVIKNPDAPDRTVVLDARINIRESTDVRPQQ